MEIIRSTERAFPSDKPEERKDERSAGAPDAVEDIVFKPSLAVGQTWRSTYDNFTLTITGQREGSKRFTVVLNDRDKKTSQELPPQNAEDLQAMLYSDKYELAADEAAPNGIQEPSLEAMPEPVSATAHREQQASKEQVDEFYRQNDEITDISENKVDSLGTEIGKLLEDNAAILGERYGGFFSLRDRLVESVNALIQDEDGLNEALENAGQHITPEFLQSKQANHRKLLTLYQDLEALHTRIGLEIAALKESSEKPALSRPVTNIAEYRNIPVRDASQPASVARLPDVILPQGGAKAEELIDVEAKVGKEQYAVLTRCAESAWEGFRQAIKGKQIPKKMCEEVWRAEALPHLGERMAGLLAERTDLGPDECLAIAERILTQQIFEKQAGL